MVKHEGSISVFPYRRFGAGGVLKGCPKALVEVPVTYIVKKHKRN